MDDKLDRFRGQYVEDRRKREERARVQAQLQREKNFEKDECPLIGGRRLIPEKYVDAIAAKLALRRARREQQEASANG